MFTFSEEGEVEMNEKLGVHRKGAGLFFRKGGGRFI
jgi:hypothetical protein